MNKVLLLCLTALFTVVNCDLWAQDRTVSGTVTSVEDGGPLPGVNVVVKNSVNGTVTDIDGKYSLSVPQDADVLVFSFIGFQSQEVEIGGRSVVDVQLAADVTQLSEVVVTAQGIEKEERSLGYAVAEIESNELVKAQSPSALNALQGKVAGVNITSASGAPGASSRIILRGFSSLGSSNQPLFVVDGVPLNNGVVGSTDLNGGLDFGNRINDLNPEDIASVSILKGASGTTLYGSRAASGVIVITTKKGESGVGKGMQVTVNSSVTFDTPLKLPTLQNSFGQGFFNERDLLENTSWGPKFDGKERLWGHVVNNTQQFKPYVALPDNIKDFWDVGQTFNNTVSLSNNTGKGTYYLSYGNVNSDGIMPTDADSYKRNTLAVRGTTKFANKLSATASLNFIAKDNKYVPTGQDQSVYDNIMQTPRDISVIDHKDYKSLFNNLDNYFSGYTINPYYVLNEHGTESDESRVFGSFLLSYPITSNLNITNRFGGDISNTHVKSWRAITQVIRNDFNDDPGRVFVNDYFNRELTNDLMLDYNKTFANDFSISALAGYNFNQIEYRASTAQVTGLDLPFFYDLSNSSATPVVDEYYEKRRLVGAYASVDLSYRNFLFLSLNARNDWSSTLPKENRSFFYPGINGAVDLAGVIPAIENVFTLAKIRAGWAKVGADASPYLINSVFGKADQFDGYRSLKYPLAGNINAFEVGNRIGNLGLTPEFTTEFEIGGDFRFFDGRLRIDGAYYDRVVTNLIWNADISYASGYSSQTLNLGEISNKGVELLLSAAPVITNDFRWDISVNFTQARNKLVKLTEGLDQIDLGGTGSMAFVARPGQPLGLFLGPVALRDPQGRIIVNATGLPIANPENQIYGNSQYDYMAGLVNDLSYKGISLGFTFDLRQGGYMYSRTAEMMYFTGTAPNTIYNDRQPFIIPNSVQEPTPGEYVENTTPLDAGSIYTYWGQSYGGGLFNKRFLVSKSFLKLRELRIGYSLPSSILSRTPFGSVEVALVGRNLLIWTPEDNHYVDPESTTFGNDLEADYGEFSATPTVRSLGANLRFTF